MNDIIRKVSPLTEASYYILSSLTEPLHGYGIIKKVDEETKQRLHLAPGTLYGVINSLLKYNLIEVVEKASIERKKITYQRTKLGSEVLVYEMKRLQEMVAYGKKEFDAYE